MLCLSETQIVEQFLSYDLLFLKVIRVTGRALFVMQSFVLENNKHDSGKYSTDYNQAPFGCFKLAQ